MQNEMKCYLACPLIEVMDPVCSSAVRRGTAVLQTPLPHRYCRTQKALKKNYKGLTKPKLCRFLTSSRKIAAGSVIFVDKPLVIAPLPFGNLVCLTCNDLIKKESMHRCAMCNWPMCSMECSDSHISKPECSYLSRDKSCCPEDLEPTGKYNTIATLRCLLLNYTNQEEFNLILSMVSHVESRIKDNKKGFIDTVNFISDSIVKDEFDRKTVYTVYSVLASNAIGIRSNQGACLRALYPIHRLLNHSCIPNVHLTDMDGGLLEVRAACDIGANEELCATYTPSVTPLWERQHIFKDSYHFTCTCARCNDPTEKGTYFSSHKCHKCIDVFMVPNQTEETLLWTCSKCNNQESYEDIKPVMDQILNESESWKTCTAHEVHLLMEKLHPRFHSQHFVAMKVTQDVIRTLQDNASELEIRLRAHIMKNLANLYSVLEPGLTRRRGMTLMETGSVILEVALKDFHSNNGPGYSQILRQALHSIDYLDEALSIHKLEPANSRGHGMKHITALKLMLAHKFKDKIRGIMLENIRQKVQSSVSLQVEDEALSTKIVIGPKDNEEKCTKETNTDIREE
ncbi:unnamed protein product, partial [Meganyctiphanes norvegica]